MAADGTTFPPFQTIPELDPAAVLNFTDQVWINQNGADLRCNIGDLAALAPAGVTMFNARAGVVTLVASDIVSAEGALINSPIFEGIPQADTAAPGTATNQLATTLFVSNAVAAATGGVTSFNNRTGAVSLTGPDIVAAGGVLRNSPAFTGQPIAPTPPPGSNSNVLATTGFVTAAVAAAIVPGVASFNDRQGNVTLTLSDVTSAGGAPLSSPVLVGVPQAPTAARGSNTTQIATTEFVQDAITSSTAGVLSFNGRQGAVTLTTADITNAGGGTVSSVGLSMPTSMFTVTGSPVTGSGVINVTANPQAASTVLAAPVAAGGPPTFRALVAGDIPLLGYLPLNGGAITGNLSVSGSLTAVTPAPGDNSTLVATTQFVDAALAALPPSGGTVTSVAMTVPNIFTLTGSPITTAGTLALGNRAQNANTVFAGPPSGGQAGGTFRALVAADIPSLSGLYLPLTGGVLNGPGNLTVSGSLSMGGQINPAMGAGGGINWNNMILEWGDAPNGAIHWGNTNGIMTSLDTAGDFSTIGNITASGNVTAGSFSAANHSAGFYINDWQLNLDGSDNFQIIRSALGAVAVFSATDGTLNTKAIAANANITSTASIIANGGVFYANNAAGTFRGLQIQSAGEPRWWILATSEAETGGNAGSNFTIYSYADNGSVLGTPLQINRATGNAAFTGQLAVTGAVTFGSNLTLTNGTINATNISASQDSYAGGNLHCGNNLYMPNSGAVVWPDGYIYNTNGNYVFVGSSGTIGTFDNAGNFGADGTISAASWIYSNNGGRFIADGPAGDLRGLAFTTSQQWRWFMYADSEAETGSNAGSNLILQSYSDAGSPVATALTINRATGAATFGGTLTVDSYILTNSNVQVNGGIVYANNAAGTYRGLQIQTNGAARWWINASVGAESGGNAGSDLYFSRYADSGAGIDAPMWIDRATGVVTFNDQILVNGYNNGGQIRMNPNQDASSYGAILRNDSSNFYILLTNLNDADGQWNTLRPFTINLANGAVNLEVVYANTPAPGDNSTAVATTAFVHNAIATGGAYLPLTGGTLTGPLVINANPTAGGNYAVFGNFVSGLWYNGERIGVNTTGTTAVIYFNNGSADIIITGSSSDRRLKSNIKAAGDALDFVKRLAVYDLDFKPRFKATEGFAEPVTEHWPFSLIADEVAEVMPHAAIKMTEDDGDHWVGLHPTHLIATLWKAVQQLTERVETLEAAARTAP